MEDIALCRLRYVRTLSETGRYRKAAEWGPVSQPLLSLPIERLDSAPCVEGAEHGRGTVLTSEVRTAHAALTRQVDSILRECPADSAKLER